MIRGIKYLKSSNSKYYATVFSILSVIIYIALFFDYYFNVPQDSDVGCFMAIGQELRTGAILYRDVWDNKAPGIFFIHSFFQWAFVGYNHYPVLIQLVSQTIFIVSLYYYLYLLLRSQILKIWLPFYLLTIFVIATEWRYFYTGGFTEEIGLYSCLSAYFVFLVGCLSAGSRKGWKVSLLFWISGLLFSITVLIKEPFIFMIVPILYFIFKNKRTFKLLNLIMFGIGVTFPLILFFIYLTSNLAFLPYVEYLKFAMNYSKSSISIWSKLFENTSKIVLEVWEFGIIYVTVTLFLIFSFIYNAFTKTNNSKFSDVTILIIMLLITCIPFYILGDITYGHYYIPFLLILALAFGVVLLKIFYYFRNGNVITWLLIIIALGFYSHERVKYRHENQVVTKMHVRDELVEINFSYLYNNRIYADDQSLGRVYYYLRSPSGSPFPCPYYMYFYNEKYPLIVEKNKIRFYTNFISDKPNYIIGKQKLGIAFEYNNLSQIVMNEYDIIDSFQLDNGTYIIRQRKDTNMNIK